MTFFQNCSPNQSRVTHQLFAWTFKKILKSKKGKKKGGKNSFVLSKLIPPFSVITLTRDHKHNLHYLCTFVQSKLVTNCLALIFTVLLEILSNAGENSGLKKRTLRSVVTCWKSLNPQVFRDPLFLFALVETGMAVTRSFSFLAENKTFLTVAAKRSFVAVQTNAGGKTISREWN